MQLKMVLATFSCEALAVPKHFSDAGLVTLRPGNTNPHPSVARAKSITRVELRKEKMQKKKTNSNEKFKFSQIRK